MNVFIIFLREEINMKKNQLFVIFGGKVNEDDEYNVRYTEYFREPKYFKNKEKANAYIEVLIDDYMKMKSYSLNYEIIEAYKDESSQLEKYITDIRDKNDYTVFRIEMTVIDLSQVIM
jgi:hypothetical protein